MGKALAREARAGRTAPIRPRACPQELRTERDRGRKAGSAELRAFNLATRDVAWSAGGLGRTTQLWVDGHLVVLGEHGQLQLVEATPEAHKVVADVTPALPAEGDGEAEPLLRYPAWSPPVLSHGLLYLRGKDRLVALELIPE